MVTDLRFPTLDAPRRRANADYARAIFDYFGDIEGTVAITV